MASVLDEGKQQEQVNNPPHYKQRIISAILIMVGLIGFFALRIWVNVYTFDLLIGILTILSAYEVDNLLHKMGRPTYFVGFGLYPILAYISILLCLYFALSLFWFVLINFGIIFVLWILMSFLPLINKKAVKKHRVEDGFKYGYVRYSINKSLNTCFVCVWPVFLIAFAFAINHFNSFEFASNQFWLSVSGVEGVDIGVLGLVLLFVSTILADTFAMFSGRLIRSPKINLQKLGKGKSWSGFVGGIVGATLGAVLVFLAFTLFSNYATLFDVLEIKLWHFVIIGLVCGLFNMIGDVFSSYFKRRAIVKDFSNLIPGHGGIMDRVNGLVFNSFCVFAILLIVFA